MHTNSENSTKQKVVSSKTKTTPGTLHHLAFDNSLHPNIISIVSTGKVVTANIAACRLLGYSKNELLTKSIEAIFEVNKISFKKMLVQRTAEGQSTALMTALRKDGHSLPCEITSAIFVDNGIKKAITTIADLSHRILKQEKIDIQKEKIVAANIVIAQNKSDTRLAENNAWIKDIAKNSYDVMWDWDITTNEIYVGDSVLEVFGYTVENNTVNYNDLKLCLVSDEKDTVTS